MRGPAALALCALIAVFAVGCGGSEKEEFQKDANSQLDKLDSQLKDLEKKAGDLGALEVVKKTSVTAARTALDASRTAVKKLDDVSDKDFESIKASVQSALDAAEKAVKDAEAKLK